MIRLWILWLQTLQGEILPALFYSSACRTHGIWDLARRWESLGAPSLQSDPNYPAWSLVLHFPAPFPF